MPQYLINLALFLGIVFVSIGFVSVIYPAPVSEFLRSRGMALRGGMPNTAQNVRIVGVVFAAFGTCALAGLAYMLVAQVRVA